MLYMNGIHQNLYIYIYIDEYHVNHVYDCMIVEGERERETNLKISTNATKTNEVEIQLLGGSSHLESGVVT